MFKSRERLIAIFSALAVTLMAVVLPAQLASADGGLTLNVNGTTLVNNGTPTGITVAGASWDAENSELILAEQPSPATNTYSAISASGGDLTIRLNGRVTLARADEYDTLTATNNVIILGTDGEPADGLTLQSTGADAHAINITGSLTLGDNDGTKHPVDVQVDAGLIDIAGNPNPIINEGSSFNPPGNGGGAGGILVGGTQVVDENGDAVADHGVTGVSWDKESKTLTLTSTGSPFGAIRSSGFADLILKIDGAVKVSASAENSFGIELQNSDSPGNLTIIGTVDVGAEAIDDVLTIDQSAVAGGENPEDRGIVAGSLTVGASGNTLSDAVIVWVDTNDTDGKAMGRVDLMGGSPTIHDPSELNAAAGGGPGGGGTMCPSGPEAEAMTGLAVWVNGTQVVKDDEAVAEHGITGISWSDNQLVFAAGPEALSLQSLLACEAPGEKVNLTVRIDGQVNFSGAATDFTDIEPPGEGAPAQPVYIDGDLTIVGTDGGDMDDELNFDFPDSSIGNNEIIVLGDPTNPDPSQAKGNLAVGLEGNTASNAVIVNVWRGTVRSNQPRVYDPSEFNCFGCQFAKCLPNPGGGNPYPFNMWIGDQQVFENGNLNGGVNGMLSSADGWTLEWDELRQMLGIAGLVVQDGTELPPIRTTGSGTLSISGTDERATESSFTVRAATKEDSGFIPGFAFYAEPGEGACSGAVNLLLNAGVFMGGIRTQGEVILSGPGGVGTADAPSETGVVAGGLEINWGEFSIFASTVDGALVSPWEDFAIPVTAGDMGDLTVSNTTGAATIGVGEVLVHGGGKVEMLQLSTVESFDFRSKYAEWDYYTMQGNAYDLFVPPTSGSCPTPGVADKCEHIEDWVGEAKYPNHFTLKSLAKPMVSLKAGVDTAAVEGGFMRVQVAKGWVEQPLPENHPHKALLAGQDPNFMDFKIEAGSEVTIELLPYYQSQYTGGALELGTLDEQAGPTIAGKLKAANTKIAAELPTGLTTTAEDGRAKFTFEMPDIKSWTEVALSDLDITYVFDEGYENLIENNVPASINGASLDLDQLFFGNGKLTIEDPFALQDVGASEVGDVNPALQIPQEDFEEAAGNRTIAQYLDLSLDEVIYKGTEQEAWETEFTQLPEDDYEDPAAISLFLADELMGFTNYVVLHDTGEGIEILPTTYDAKTGKLSFETRGFSTFAIAHGAKAAATDATVYFNGNSAKLTKASKSKIKKLVNGTGEVVITKVTVKGFVNSKYSWLPLANKRLANKRAKAVANYVKSFKKAKKAQVVIKSPSKGAKGAKSRKVELGLTVGPSFN